MTGRGGYYLPGQQAVQGNGYGGQVAATFPPQITSTGRQTINQQTQGMGAIYGSATYQNQVGQYGQGQNQLQSTSHGQMMTPAYNVNFPALQYPAVGQYLNQPPPPPPAQN